MKFDDFLTSAAGTAKRLAHSAKKNVNILAEEDKIKDAYREIGRLYCEAIHSGAPLTGPAYDRQLDIIEAAQERVEELKNTCDD